MCYLCCCCSTKSRSSMRGLAIAYTILMFCYHVYEIKYDLSDILKLHDIPVSPFGELFDHMGSYRPLLYVSLVANIIVIIILCCLFYYAIMNSAFFVRPFKFIYPIYLTYYTLISIYLFGYKLNEISTKESSEYRSLTEIFITIFLIWKILYICLGFDFYLTVRKYSKLVEEEQKYEKYNECDFEKV